MTTLRKYKIAAVPIGPAPLGLVSTGRHAAPEAPAQIAILDAQPGPLTWRDKVKAYYHTLIVAVGSLLAVLSAVTLPGDAGKWVAAAVLVLTTIKTALTANEVWISEL